MAGHHLELAVEPDREAVRVTVMAGDEAMFSARLEAPELDELIHALAAGRAKLREEVSPSLDQGARLADVEVDPAYLVGKNSAQGEALLALRHPGFGWLGFRLKRPVIEAMVERLGRWLGETV